MTTTKTPAREAAAMFRAAVAGARATAMKHTLLGDLFAARLATERADVYERGAALVTHIAMEEVAPLMWAQAKERHVTSLGSLADTDARCLDYAAAHAWQWCAWQLDPDLPVVQQAWT
jgi:hypothetical protein